VNLEEYFRNGWNNVDGAPWDKDANYIDHAIRHEVRDGKVRFYIHPMTVNGPTLDFEIEGNTLKQLYVPS